MGWGEVDRDKENQDSLDKQTGIDRPKEQKEWFEDHRQTYRSPDDTSPSSQQNHLEDGTWTGRIKAGRTLQKPPNPRGRGGFATRFC